MDHIRKSAKLAEVFYDIRGPVMELAQKMERAGETIIKLNIGNLAYFGFEPPAGIVAEINEKLATYAGYTDSKGLESPRQAVAEYAAEKNIADVTADDVYLGNGASELITMSLNAMLDAGDEVLVPSPDYPLWTGAVTLSGGRAVHYVCDETNDWLPDLDDIRQKITPRTRGIVIINPNNPTGALYPAEHLSAIVEIARQNGLVIFADEIYDKTLFDGNRHTSIASLAPDFFCLTFNGLSKNYRACGYRAGWMIVSGDRSKAADYVMGLNMLASMRLCSNTPGQIAIESALRGENSIADLVASGGRLCRQRDIAFEMFSNMPGVNVVKPKAALYMFPGLDPAIYPIADDQEFACHLLAEEKVLIVQGSGFNWKAADHFRMVFLPEESVLVESISRIGSFLTRYRECSAAVRA